MFNITCPPVGSWLKNSFIDFPGTVSTVLFFKGCNLRCPYCHNSELVTGTPPLVDPDAIYSFLRKRTNIIEGIVLSGGEPTIHGESLVPFVKAVRQLGMKIKLDTNGLLPEMIPRIAPDYLALDLKTTPECYYQLGWHGENPEKALLESIAIVKEMGPKAEVRITAAAPFINDEITVELARMLKGVGTVYLQPFVNSGTCLDAARVGTIGFTVLEKYQKQIASAAANCTIRGFS